MIFSQLIGTGFGFEIKFLSQCKCEHSILDRYFIGDLKMKGCVCVFVSSACETQRGF